jgi:hypothetical protein
MHESALKPWIVFGYICLFITVFLSTFFLTGCSSHAVVQAQPPENPIEGAIRQTVDLEDGMVTMPDGTKKPRLTRVYQRRDDFLIVVRDNSNGCEFLIQSDAAPALIPGTCIEAKRGEGK